MESPKKGKKNFLTKTWERCRSFPSKKKVASEGFFPVYVGPEKQWFAVRMKYANHPLFRMLLEDAEIEYGYDTPGPILLPCDVDLFYEVVAEMEAANEMEQPRGCGFVYGLCSPFNNPSRRIGNARENQMDKGYGGYGLLTPSRLLMN